MLAILPPLCFGLIFLILNNSKKAAMPAGWRVSFLLAAAIWGAIVTVATELLSALNLITVAWLTGLWGIVGLMCALVLGWKRKNIFQQRGAVHNKFSCFDSILLSSVSFIITAAGITALIAPPNTWDSMTYHMSRVMHWMQNQNVAFYATNNLRQLHQNPWAEFAIMHFQILSSDDRFANSIQWFSMLGSIIGVSLIAEQLGAGLRGQIFASVVTATIPMGILQASSTQNDYVVSFWLVCFVYFLMFLKRQASWMYVFATGAGLGLAFLTKAVAYIYALPFLAWYIAPLLKKPALKCWKPAAIIVVIAVMINAGHYYRNFNLYGNLLGPGTEGSAGSFTYANDVFTPASVFSNVLRNLAVHMSTPISEFNSAAEKAIFMTHRLLDIDAHDPRTTWTGEKFRIPGFIISEDFTGNTIHVVLIGIAGILFFSSKKLRASHFLLSYFIAVSGAFILFSMYLKWQPWHSRLHLPLFVLIAPFIGIAFSHLSNFRGTSIIMLLLVLSSLPFIFYNSTRPLLGKENIFAANRIDQYFRNNPEAKKQYIAAASFIRSQGCYDLGLSIGGDDWEYPFWVLLKKGSQYPRINHLNVKNLSGFKSPGPSGIDVSPCAIISSQHTQPSEQLFFNKRYQREWSSRPFSIFIKQP